MIPSRSALILIVLTLAAAPAAAAPQTRPFDDVPEFAGLTERWAAAAEALHVPGYAIAVVKDGEVLSMEGFGVRDVDPAKRVTPETMFYIASCTKTFTAMGLAALADDGRIDLDAPVKRYLPRFELADEEASRSVTVRDLLSHKPGINKGEIVFLDAYTGQITEDRFYHWLREVEPTGEVEYTNVHFTLAGRVIEAVTGQSWKDYLDERIFDPAGMHRTTAYASRMYADPNVAFPLEGGPGDYERCSVIKSDNVMHAAGGSGTTAYDAARWLTLHMNGGTIDGERVLSERMADEMLAFQSRLDEPNGRIRRIEGFGLAWFRGTFRGRPGYCQHGGGYIGTAAHFSFLKDHGIGVVILANAAPAGQAFMDVASIDIYDRLLGHEPEFDLLPRYIERIEGFRQRLSGMNIDSEPADDRALSQPLHAYTGVYSNPWWGDVFVELENDALTARIGEMPLTVSAGDAEDDVVIIEPDFDTRPARFVVDDRGRITALELFGRRDDGKAIEFVRQ